MSQSGFTEILLYGSCLCSAFPSLSHSHSPTPLSLSLSLSLSAILAALWQNYVNGIPVYEHIVVCGQPGKTFQLPGVSGAEPQPPRVEETDLTEEEVHESLSALAIQVGGEEG